MSETVARTRRSERALSEWLANERRRSRRRETLVVFPLLGVLVTMSSVAVWGWTLL